MPVAQPYETFQMLLETGGADRVNSLLVAACDAYARGGRPTSSEIAQFEALASQLFLSAGAQAKAKAASILGRAPALSPSLEQLVMANIGDDLHSFLQHASDLTEATMLKLIATKDLVAAAILASRDDLSNAVLTKLFQLNSRKVYRALAANPQTTPKGAYLAALARSAQMDHLVAEALAKRPDFDAGLLAPAFFDLSDIHRLKVIEAFAHRQTPDAPSKQTIEQLTVANGELTRALVKLFSENRRAEVANLLAQITGLDEVRCGQIAHDPTGTSLFVVLRAFGTSAFEGLKVLIVATSHDGDLSGQLADFATLFSDVPPDAMGYLISAWRGQVNLLELAKPEYQPFTQASRRTPQASATHTPALDQVRDALGWMEIQRAG
jgi:hypothetical protein